MAIALFYIYILKSNKIASIVFCHFVLGANVPATFFDGTVSHKPIWLKWILMKQESSKSKEKALQKQIGDAGSYSAFTNDPVHYIVVNCNKVIVLFLLEWLFLPVCI